MQRISAIVNKPVRKAIGLISGTSVDGIDTALVEVAGYGINARLELRRFEVFPYPAGLPAEIIRISHSGSVEEICRINFFLGELFAEAALNLIESAGLQPGDIDVIGSHGQTVQHLAEPIEYFGRPISATLQLGDPSVIAQKTSIVTVGDFRPADMAVGGQGAPLVPFFDYVFFGSKDTSRALINIGGISNITVLPAAAKVEDILAFDCGPGNMVIDYVVQALTDERFDRNGEFAQSGRIQDDLLHFALSHPFFEKQPPKSTGREAFGKVFSDALLTRASDLKCDLTDIICTVSELTVRTITDSHSRFIAPVTDVREFIVSGGGASNSYLMRRLGELLAPAQVATTDEYGLSIDAKEAVCFALLANETLGGNPSNVPGATGASKPAILGKICL